MMMTWGLHCHDAMVVVVIISPMLDSYSTPRYRYTHLSCFIDTCFHLPDNLNVWAGGVGGDYVR